MSSLLCLDLFSGTGAFALGFEVAGIKTGAFCESDANCVSVIQQHWPDTPVYRDVRSLSITLGFADIITGGFPCQPFSTAARGRNNACDLWPEFLRIVQDGKPTWVVAENVPGIGDEGTERVCRDLEAEGFEVWPFDVDTALPTRQRGRMRRFWLAYANRDGEPRRSEHAKVAGIRPVSGPSWPNDAAPLGVDDGLPGRMDRLHMLGNAVTVNIAEAIGRVIRQASTS